MTQINDYYPMGSLMASSWTKEDYLSPGMMYQSFFSDYDSLAGTYDFLLRNYDPLLGRWWQSDPYNQFANPYNGMGNRAHSSIDPDGGVVPLLVDMAIWAVVGGYAGGYISSGDPRPWNWHNEDWAWVAGGAIVGAGFGYGVDFLGDHLYWNDGSYLTRSNPEGKVKWANGDRPGFKWKSDLKYPKIDIPLEKTFNVFDYVNYIDNANIRPFEWKFFIAQKYFSDINFDFSGSDNWEGWMDHNGLNRKEIDFVRHEYNSNKGSRFKAEGIVWEDFPVRTHLKYEFKGTISNITDISITSYYSHPRSKLDVKTRVNLRGISQAQLQVLRYNGWN